MRIDSEKSPTEKDKKKKEAEKACTFVFPRTVCKREITRDEALHYLREGKTELLKIQTGVLDPDGNEALQLLNVDPLPGDEVLDAVRQLAGIESVHLLDLGRTVS